MRFARACAADQHQIASAGQEATAGEVVHQGFSEWITGPNGSGARTDHGPERIRGPNGSGARTDQGIGVLVKTNSSTSPASGFWGEWQLRNGQLVLHPPPHTIRIVWGPRLPPHTIRIVWGPRLPPHTIRIVWGPRGARLLLVELGGEQIADGDT